MGDYFGLSVDGTAVETDEMLSLSEGFRVRVEGDYEGGADHTCQHCGADVDADGADCESGETECPENSDGYAHDDDEYPDCGPDCQLDGSDPDADDHYTRETFGAHSPVRKSLSWVNSASLDLDPRDNSVTVGISVGDPRGAFVMTVREVTPDEGDPYLIMHTPYPAQGWGHMPLEYLSQGTYKVLHSGATAVPDPRTLPAPEPVAPATRRERIRRAVANTLRRLAGRIDF